MEENKDKILSNLKNYLNQYKSLADDEIWKHPETFQYYEFCQTFFQKNKIEQYEWKDFQNIKNNLNCYVTFPLAAENAFGKPNHEIEHYKKVFSYMLDESLPIKDRIKTIVNNNEYKISYLNNGLFEIIGYKFPDEFIIKNSTSDVAIKVIGEDTKFSYEQFNDYLTKRLEIQKLYKEIVGQRTSYPINIEIDRFLYWLATETNEGKEINKKMKNKKKSEPTQSEAEKEPSIDNNNKYWLYQPGEKGRFWDEFSSKNIIGIGWDDIGNLKTYKTQEEIENKIIKIYHPNKKPKNDTKALWEFANEMNIGDIVFVKKDMSNTLLGRGIVKSDYIYDENRNEYRNIRQINWTHKGEYIADFNYLQTSQWPIKTLTDISENKYNDFCLKIEEIFIRDKQPHLTKNQILYGPPGTGKTYNTVVYAVSIIENKTIREIQQEDYKTVQERYRNYKEQGRIEFITFHQSYSYEEFVEGIKPDINSSDENNIKYILQDGIFKKMCDNNNFDEVYKKFYEYIIDKDIYLYSIPGNAKFKIEQSKSDNNDSIKIIPQTDQETANFVRKAELLEIEKMDGRQGYAKAILKFMKEKFLDKPKVLIIDEINRGNISKIFGELITLIEEDKRLGEDNELKVTLPYSQKSFGVPNNLYIIGTMNTADRSIASVDIALRRRFKFIEMMPDNSKIADFGIVKFPIIFDELNNNIEILLDRDHKIGHSYFIKEKYKDADCEKLCEIWFDSIIPLLNEYFYNDWEKLYVLIPGFINKNDEVPDKLKEYCSTDSYYSFKSITDFYGANGFNDTSFKDALNTILDKKMD